MATTGIDGLGYSGNSKLYRLLQQDPPKQADPSDVAPEYPYQSIGTINYNAQSIDDLFSNLPKRDCGGARTTRAYLDLLNQNFFCLMTPQNKLSLNFGSNWEGLTGSGGGASIFMNGRYRTGQKKLGEGDTRYFGQFLMNNTLRFMSIPGNGAMPLFTMDMTGTARMTDLWLGSGFRIDLAANANMKLAFNDGARKGLTAGSLVKALKVREGAGDLVEGQRVSAIWLMTSATLKFGESNMNSGLDFMFYGKFNVTNVTSGKTDPYMSRSDFGVSLVNWPGTSVDLNYTLQNQEPTWRFYLAREIINTKDWQFGLNGGLTYVPAKKGTGVMVGITLDFPDVYGFETHISGTVDFENITSNNTPVRGKKYPNTQSWDDIDLTYDNEGQVVQPVHTFTIYPSAPLTNGNNVTILLGSNNQAYKNTADNTEEIFDGMVFGFPGETAITSDHENVIIYDIHVYDTERAPEDQELFVTDSKGKIIPGADGKPVGIAQFLVGSPLRDINSAPLYIPLPKSAVSANAAIEIVFTVKANIEDWPQDGQKGKMKVKSIEVVQ